MPVYWTDSRRFRSQIVVLVLVLLALLVGVSRASAQVYMGIEGPAGDVASPVSFCGFALDISTKPRAGITAVTAYFSTPTGLVIVPAQIGMARPDISAVFSSPSTGYTQDANVGWCVPPTAVPPGTTNVNVVATGTKLGPDGHRLVAQRDTTFSIGSALFSWQNFPKQGQTVSAPFDVIGVAFDPGGIRFVTVETVDRAHPDNYPRLWGYAAINQPRADAYNGWGYTFKVSGITPGTYDLKVTAYAWSGAVETRVTHITVP